MSNETAIEAAREWARENVHDRHARFTAIEAFMAGAAWQSAQTAKLLEGVVRARDLKEGG